MTTEQEWYEADVERRNQLDKLVFEQGLGAPYDPKIDYTSADEDSDEDSDDEPVDGAGDIGTDSGTDHGGGGQPGQGAD